MSLSWWGSTLVAVLLLCLVACGFSAWCAHLTRQARAEAAASTAAARRVAAWCGIPEWWQPSDRWPAERPPNDRATAQARWEAVHGVTPPQGDPSWSALQQAAAAEHASTEQLPRYRPLRVDEFGGGGPR